MGGIQSTGNISQPIKVEEQKINILTHVEENEEEIFSKISDLTKEILIKYSDMHLDENFCNNLSIIYQDKLSTLKIKLLRDIYNKISGKKIQYELLLVNKYPDKNDDRFKVEDDLKIGIEELFFNQNIKFNPTYLSDIELFDSNIKIDDIFKKIFTNKKYIDGSINFSDLLNDKSRFQRKKSGNNQNNNEEKPEEQQELEKEQEENNNNSLIGGAVNNYLFKKNNPQIRQPFNKQQKQQFQQQKYKQPFKQQFQQQKQPFQQQRQYKEPELSFQNQNPNKLVGYKNQQEEINRLLSNNSIKSYQPNNNNNNNESNNNNNESPENLYGIQPQNEIPSNLNIANASRLKNNNNSISKISRLINFQKEKPQTNNTNNIIAKLKKNLNNARREKNLLLQEKQKQQEQPSNRQPSNRQPSNRQPFDRQPFDRQPFNRQPFNRQPFNRQPFNKQPSEKNIRNKEQKPNFSQQKVTNIFSTPTNFKVKNPCSGKDVCFLNKKQICELISQHFIVRNNIIAAILSCIPRKVGNNYEGGICYQQFINLNNCKVCIPENYKDLLNSNNKDKSQTAKFIQDIATFSLNLTKESCKENNGTYYNLSKSQEIALVDKAKTNKMNAFFFVCRKKIKEVYLQNLKLLIDILNKLNDTPVINNSTLNIISNDTKTIIDRMYTLCQYYYIYAIISLLNADITTEEKKKKNFFKKEVKNFV